VAILAILGSGFVEKNLLAVDVAEELVAVGTAHILVRACQRKLGSLVMIKERGLPLGDAVAVGTGCDSFGLGELTAVNILMAVFAFRRSLGEINVEELGFKVGRFVAIDTRDRTMRTEQSELGAVVIEAREVFPILGGVAGFATDGRTVSAESLHALGELPVVRIFVAGRAGKLLEMINSGGVVARSWLGGR